ncbi:dienelactone hydrolase family protein [Nonomuraea sp. NPDC050404]|uniref:dienelactone hydrolase family protein n=1 Tax=Nonomuraea sp. NPDC050404 TaxID=3155783 RepID=UPI003409F5C6
MTQNVRIPLADGSSLAATMVLPNGTAPPSGWPGVVVVHEIYGVEPDMLEVAERFGEHGYAAVLPDLYSHGSKIRCLARNMRQLAMGGHDGPVADIDATRRWLAGREEVDDGRLGVIGFCMGGGFALAYAAGPSSGVRAAAVNYGAVPRRKEELASVCPVVASYGGRDMGFRAHGERLREHLRALGVDHDVTIYPEAGHSFMTDGHHPIARLALFPLRHGLVRPAADDAWQRTLSFFDRHVAGQQ